MLITESEFLLYCFSRTEGGQERRARVFQKADAVEGEQADTF